MTILAITGGTGFVGSRVIALALAGGHDVRALARRPQPPRDGVTWVEGALDVPASLDTLVRGADAVLHIAGVVNAPDRAGFAAGNVAGTQAVVDAATRAGVGRFVHVSSLSAREPALSNYGWSKAEAETVVQHSNLDWTIVRPPGIYGPGDLELRDVFRLAQFGVAFLPPHGRASWIAVEDLGRLLLALVAKDVGRLTLEPDDGADDGWTHVAFAQAIGASLGRRVVTFSLPKPLLATGAWIDGVFRGKGAKLTPDRVGYLCHPDWTVDPAARPDAAIWTPRIPTEQGLADTAAWYRANGLL